MQQKGGLVVVDIIVVVIALIVAGIVSYAIYTSYQDVERTSAQTTATPPPDNDVPEINTNPENAGGELELMTIRNGDAMSFNVLIGKF